MDLKTNKIYLRKLNENNASIEYCSWLNDVEVNRYLETHKTTIEELKEFINKCNNNKNCLLFGIFDINNNIHIGNIKLEPIEWDNKISEIGIMIGDKNYWGKGFGHETLKIIIKYCFEVLKLEKLKLGVNYKNIRAIRLYEKRNFEKYDFIDNKNIRMQLINKNI